MLEGQKMPQTVIDGFINLLIKSPYTEMSRNVVEVYLVSLYPECP